MHRWFEAFPIGLRLRSFSKLGHPAYQEQYSDLVANQPIRRVSYWLVVNARDLRLHSNEIFVEPTIWEPGVSVHLADVTEALEKARSAWFSVCREWERCSPAATEAERKMWNDARWKTFRAAYQHFRPRYDLTDAEMTNLKAKLKAFSVQMATPVFMKRLAAEVIPLKVQQNNNDERSYALYRGSVWSCGRELEPAQWQLLVDRLIRSEEAELASALAIEADASQTRERISPQVRRAVWIRDQGKCARCGSRERLEYDHIVPVSRGGSNTERNIELLCEVCNRAKSDSIM